MRPKFLLGLIVSLCALFPAVSSADGITRSVREDDTRLQQRVTVQRPYLYIGDLLEDLARQTGVDIRPGELNDGTADERVTAFLKNVTLADAMDGLWSLMSYRRGAWHWERKKSSGVYHYRLLRPLGARQLRARLATEAQEAFERQARSMIAASKMSPEQRSQLAETDEALKPFLENERYWSGLRTFATSFPQDTQLRILRGEISPQIRTSDLSPEGMAFVTAIWEKGGKQGVFGAKLENPDQGPAWVRFTAPFFNSSRGTRNLMIFVEGMGGYAYLGGTPMDEANRKKIATEWILPGDGLDHPMNGRVVDSIPNDKLSILNEKSLRVVEKRLGELHLAAPLSLLAYLPREQSFDYGSPVGKQLGEYLKRMSENPPHLAHKWRGSVLLFTYPAFHRPDVAEAIVPWAIAKRTQSAAARQNGVLGLNDLCVAAKDLNSAQLMALSDDYPIMRLVSVWRDLFVIGVTQPALWKQLCSAKGVSVARIEFALSPTNRRQLDRLLSQNEGVCLQVSDEQFEVSGKLVAGVSINILTKDGKRLAGQRESHVLIRNGS